MKNSLLTAYTLWRREMVRFYRQPSRVVGALGSPLLFWLLIGSGIGHSFRSGNEAGSGNYLEYFFPGTILMILLFTAIFSTISLIEDRREGFFQSVLVAPVSRASIVLGKILGGTSLALTQSLLFLLLSPFLGIHLGMLAWLKLLSVLFVSAFGLTGLGFLIAWQFNSVQGFHAVMNLLLMPLWILSGALFPEEGAFGWIKAVMKLNPLTYQNIALRQSLFQTSAGSAMSFGDCMIINFIFAFAMLGASTFVTSRTKSQDLK